MDVLVAGGHGQVALHLLRLLAEHGHHGRGLIRNEAHAADLEQVGAVPVLCDLEADDPASAPEAMRPYQQAKHDADEALAGSSLVWTIVRPGGLTDVPGSGRVALAERLRRSGSIPREDVARLLLECLTAPATVRRTFDVLEGDLPIREALAAL